MIEAKTRPEGIIRLPVYSSGTLYTGAAMYWGVDASNTSTASLIITADTGADIFAVLQAGSTSCASNVQTPIIYQLPVMLVDNPKVWRIEYDMSTSNDADVDSYTSPTITVAACDDNLDGSWVYLNSGTGVGQLRYIKGANTTTFTLNTALTTAADATTDIILIRNVGRPTAGFGLDSTRSMIATVLDETTSTNIICLRNFIRSGGTGVKELDITLNPDLECNNLNSRGVGFFMHGVFADTAIHAQGIA